MSAGFRAVQWNRAKVVYDLVLLVAVAAFLIVYAMILAGREPPANAKDAVGIYIRVSGLCAFVMLTVILSIGPLARLDRRLLPLLYNRRHFGVLTCIVVLTHFAALVGWYVLDGHPYNLVAELTKWSDYASLKTVSFKAFGLGGLLILLLLAATSHDYWLAFLTPPVWKALHMLLYLAYGLILIHIALGVLQDERSWLVIALFAAAFVWVAALHIVTGLRERGRDGATEPRDGWLTVGAPESIPDKAARIVSAPGGERIAVFRDGDEIGALANLCAHQNGPLGEGRIIDGCVTCPWHGYQYHLSDGCAPAPFTEKLATYRLRLRDGLVEVDPKPLPPGTPASMRVTPSA